MVSSDAAQLRSTWHANDDAWNSKNLFAASYRKAYFVAALQTPQLIISDEQVEEKA
jgi:hypothetical protein